MAIHTLWLYFSPNFVFSQALNNLMSTPKYDRKFTRKIGKFLARHVATNNTYMHLASSWLFYCRYNATVWVFWREHQCHTKHKSSSMWYLVYLSFLSLSSRYYVVVFFLQGNNRYPSNLNGGIDATVSQCHLHMALYLPSQKETTWWECQ